VAEKWQQELNRLERMAFNAEESASEVRWQQADLIVRTLDSGKTKQAVADGWINLQTGKPYSESTVRDYAKAANRAGPRGSFQEAIYKIRPSSGSEARMERNHHQLPSNEEGVAMVLEKAAKVLQDKYDWTEAEVKQEIAAAKVKTKAEPVEAGPTPKVTRYDLMVEFLDTIRTEFGDRPFTQREQTKAEEISLELQIRIGAEVR
jgi:hypothetical protein